MNIALDSNPIRTAFLGAHHSHRQRPTTLPRRPNVIVCSSSGSSLSVTQAQEEAKRIGSLSQVSGVLGCQWGDEGKGKLVDILAHHFHIVARSQVPPPTIKDERERGREIPFNFVVCLMFRHINKFHLNTSLVTHSCINGFVFRVSHIFHCKTNKHLIAYNLITHSPFQHRFSICIVSEFHHFFLSTRYCCSMGAYYEFIVSFF